MLIRLGNYYINLEMLSHAAFGIDYNTRYFIRIVYKSNEFETGIYFESSEDLKTAWMYLGEQILLYNNQWNQKFETNKQT